MAADAQITEDIRIHVEGSILTVAASDVIEAIRRNTGVSPMTALELAKLVQQLRTAQKQYFYSHTASAEEERLRLEKKVDRCCTQILEGQKELFSKD